MARLMNTSRSLLAELRRYKFRLLLASLFALSVVAPLAESFGSAQLIYVILLQVALVCSLVAVSQNRRRLVVAVILGSLAMSDTSREYFRDSATLNPSALVFLTMFFGFLAAVFLAEVLHARNIDVEQICGALCVYLLIGIVWGFLYALVLHTDPEAIRFPPNTVADNSSRLTYFSFVTLTTLGFGDIHPLTPIARTLCWIEAILGQIFLAVLLARLVGLNLAQSLARNQHPSDLQ